MAECAKRNIRRAFFPFGNAHYSLLPIYMTSVFHAWLHQGCEVKEMPQNITETMTVIFRNRNWIHFWKHSMASAGLLAEHFILYTYICSHRGTSSRGCLCFKSVCSNLPGRGIFVCRFWAYLCDRHLQDGINFLRAGWGKKKKTSLHSPLHDCPLYHLFPIGIRKKPNQPLWFARCLCSRAEPNSASARSLWLKAQEYLFDLIPRK